jgi:dihydrofolate synthase/folylpolyglutamate synthase
MGSPRPARCIVTVAGTNGKGSTVACLVAMGGALGLRGGCYTSPHLFHYNERITIEGTPVPDDAIVSAFEVVEANRAGADLTYFEFGTLAAFQVLALARLDFAVLEVGLGGRLDAVNIVDSDCAVVTKIDLDHQQYLGDDRDSIGREKAAIARPGKALVCGDRDPPEGMIRVASAIGSTTYVLGRDFDVDGRSGRFRFPDLGAECRFADPVLGGVHQQDNRAAAMAAMLLCWPDSRRHIAACAAAGSRVAVPGRLQQVGDRPNVFVDVGHNPLAARAVADWLRTEVTRGREPVCCVLAMYGDKDAEGVVEALAGEVDQWFCAGIDGTRAQSGRQLAERAGRALDEPPASFLSVESALSAAMAAAGEGGTVIVFGSFVTAAAAIRCLS